MKRIQFFVLSLFTIVMVQSCKKQLVDKPLGVATTANTYTTDQQQAILKNIKDFYALMKTKKATYKSHAKTIADSLVISPDSANFITEAVYNFYVTKSDELDDVERFHFSVEEPLNTAGDINMDDVANAFWSIKDQLTQKLSSSTYASQELANFDLSYVINNGRILFMVDAALTVAKTTLVRGPQVVFTGSPNHAWQLGDQTSFNNLPNYAEMDINLSTYSPIQGTTVNNKYSAENMLKKYGLINYRNGTIMLPPGNGVYVNIVPHMTTPLTSNNPNFPYAAYSGCINSTMFSVYDYFIDQYQFTSAPDPTGIFKNWLTTPAMNFYLSYIPSILNTYASPAVVSGTRVYDFQIDMTWFMGTSTQTNQNNYYLRPRFHTYTVKTGTFIQTDRNNFIIKVTDL